MSEELELDHGVEVMGADSYKSGLVEDMDFSDYLAIDAASSSKLKTIIDKSPLHLKAEEQQTRKASTEMDIGTAVHCMVLTPDLIDVTVVEMPDLNLRKPADRERKEAIISGLEPGQVLLKPDEIHRAECCARAIQNHKGAMHYLEMPGRSELSGFWQDNETRTNCKMRFDRLTDDLIAVDLKTTNDASQRGFMRTIQNFRYDVQAGFYNSGSEHVFNESLRYWLWIAAEYQAPYGVQVFLCPAPLMAIGLYRANDALAQYALAKESGFWPSYPETIQRMEMPRYYMQIAQ